MSHLDNFIKYFFRSKSTGISIDFSQVGFSEEFLSNMHDKVIDAFDEMSALEAGAIANKDENRMVGHYWLRNASMSPTEDIQNQINETYNQITKLSSDIHFGNISGKDGKFKNAIFIGIGGSSLGPQLLNDSIKCDNKICCYFIDNTDPDGIDSILEKLDGEFGKTLVVVTSKSGSTPEPRNAMKEVEHAYYKAGLSFHRQAIAITQEGSVLWKYANTNGWICCLPMWDWVGGRTSIFSAVGLLPAALRGIDIKSFIDGARNMDDETREKSDKNPAMMLALSWYYATDGIGSKDMVVLPYKDRLSTFPKYLQQLIMESIGKKYDRDGNIVNQGITVYGNKGSTDQHSFVQQLRDGLKNFFITVISVLKSRDADTIPVDDNGMTSVDYLNGFALGTMRALSENGTSVIHIMLDQLSEYELGALIALYERAVGFYASLVNVNAYNQPGVEAGKKASSEILKIQKTLMDILKKDPNKEFSLTELSRSASCDDIPLVFKLLEHMSANGLIKKNTAKTIFDSSYKLK